MRIYKDKEEEYVVKRITDRLNIQVENERSLTQEKKEPPDYYFEIGGHKIVCEVTRFRLIGRSSKGNLAHESAIKHEIGERAQRSLQEKEFRYLY